MKSAPLILFALDRDGIFTLSEGTGLESLGLLPGHSVGTSVFDLYESEPAVLDAVRRALAGDEVVEVVTLGGITFAVRYSPQFDESGKVSQVVGVAIDITPQKRAEGELGRRVAFDSLIHRTFNSFIEIAPDDTTSPKRLDAAILEALAEVGGFTEAARTYILEKSDDGDSLNTTYEWCAEGTAPTTTERLREISTAAIPWVMDQIEEGKPVHIPAIDDLEPDKASQLRHLGCVGIRSMVNLPLVTRGRVVGAVGFEWTHPSSQVGVEEEISQLTVIQNLFANALQQRRVGGALQRVNRLLRAVLECSDALTRARDEKVLLSEVCRIVVEVGGFTQAWVGFGMDDEAQSILPVAQWGYDEGYVENLKITWADTDKGQGPMGKAIRTRVPASIPNIATDVGFEPWRAEAINRGCRSCLAVPLVFGDELLGAFLVYSTVPWAFDTLEVEILQRFAGYLSYGIGALRSQARREFAEGKLWDSLRSKEQLVATISHEMRTPLTAVVGFAELLQFPESGLSDDERIEMIRSIADEGRDLTNIVDDLMTAAKAEAGTLTVVRVPVDLRALASQVLETMRKGQPVEITGDSLRGSGDPSRVRQILRNLISNAVRYGGEDIRICIFDSPTPRAEVRDNGDGIPAEERERVFDAYQRAHDAPGLTASMGLGLTISRSLARLMGGDLSYRYEGGESVFELQLPALHLNRVLPDVTVTPDLGRR
ncbi:MAG TPA: GAF domain-containing protein [Acidimicrobiia bacterium]|nr:GAF domain-containing protein [Acidimicrobiia bacterium]